MSRPDGIVVDITQPGLTMAPEVRTALEALAVTAKDWSAKDLLDFALSVLVSACAGTPNPPHFLARLSKQAARGLVMLSAKGEPS